MIQKVDDSFPVPVSGKPIQRGWFGALVRFMNSLRLRGDGRYFLVSRNTGGTTIAPSNALIQALERSGGAAPAAGGTGTTYGIEATIDGSTASIALVEGGTSSSIALIPTAPITLTVGANGELIIGSTVSGGTTYGLEGEVVTSIEGTTASIELVPGGTSSFASIIPGSNMSISADTNGDIVISQTNPSLQWPSTNQAAYIIPALNTSILASTGGWLTGVFTFLLEAGSEVGRYDTFFLQVAIWPDGDTNHTAILYETLRLPSIVEMDGSSEVYGFTDHRASMCLPIPPGYRYMVSYEFSGSATDDPSNGLRFYPAT